VSGRRGADDAGAVMNRARPRLDPRAAVGGYQGVGIAFPSRRGRVVPLPWGFAMLRPAPVNMQQLGPRESAEVQ
jgi:hypothetical protein